MPMPLSVRSYVTSIASTQEEVRAAQRLRYQVFAEEKGAVLHTPLPGHDIDDFDAHVDHLIVSERGTGEVVGTYRLLPPGRTPRLYSDGEFDLAALDGLRDSLVETGRACVHPDHRDGTVINLMWSGLARYVLLSGHRYLAGCASVPLDDGGLAAANAALLGSTKYASPREFRVTPREPWTGGQPLPGAPSPALLPPLLRGYLRVGAWMCGAPAHDRDFGDADFFVLLDLERMNDRYRRYYLGEDR
ncbi:GNAT family N-acetyltransferase [Actinacidiphila bryophytorum]|uniref:Ornithine-acyl(Acyl carrier protein) N-acyltransferase n=1 Tax=Actinacidiphila bryophytorum TaxID=1436133 RepID=A0A9W4H4H6_9ACTN|nr:GNAT family N-acetyltransferase [Actinacidiphila bryophytorum]MBM9435847.1 GNAT family N-acetyltransferase [Actinacidiphila bryophytorum]MBN6543282.1 GNAT family N-acetyltransferase [Actinacidiphila bryophytorum]CAG7649921.1 Ornithine-acyl(acyl carrier protein) N-acyltransferase [Actinacidiphila bryophytorum]